MNKKKKISYLAVTSFVLSMLPFLLLYIAYQEPLSTLSLFLMTVLPWFLSFVVGLYGVYVIMKKRDELKGIALIITGFVIVILFVVLLVWARINLNKYIYEPHEKSKNNVQSDK